MSIPVRFLPQVMGDLVAAGIVEATTGRAGGYRLTRPSSAISVLDVVEAVEGDSRRRTCVLRGGPCGLDGHCDVHDLFFEAQDAMLQILGQARLADLPVRRGGHLPVIDGPLRTGRLRPPRRAAGSSASPPQDQRIAPWPKGPSPRCLRMPLDNTN